MQHSGLDPFSDMQEDSGDHVSANPWKHNYSLSAKDKEEMGTSINDQYNDTSASDKRGIRLHNPACVNLKHVQGSKKSRITNRRNKGQFRVEKV